MLDMESFLDRQSDNYSSGMKQKTALARAVIHKPKVVILDEPTTGLDIMATQVVMGFVRHLKEENIPVVFSTHHLDEVEEVCDLVTVIDKGTTSFEGSFDDFKSLSDDGLHNAFMASIK
jgi:sodium transport system ATP-binding protein